MHAHIKHPAAQTVSLRDANAADADILLDWQNHPSTRRYFHNPEVPSAQEHYSWFARRLADRRGLFAIIIHDDTPSGMVRFDARDDNLDLYDISIAVAPDQRNRGIAGTALRAAINARPGLRLRAEVHVDNLASHRLFESANFVKQNGYYLYDGLHPERI
jgi:UDP-2,4-diacetamido-2,4,6-trideoxy-beta-L-altropyranose hydrolase